MTPVSPDPPATPLEAAGCPSALDDYLDVALFKALGDPTRLRLFACLVKCDRPCSVSELAACCAVDFSVVARHLRQLAAAGVLSVRKEGRTVFYRPESEALARRLHALATAVEAWSSSPPIDPCCPAPGADDRGPEEAT